MSINNLISVAFTADELTQLDASLTAIEKPKTGRLKPLIT